MQIVKEGRGGGELMDDKTIENRLHLFEDVASDNHDTIYEVVSAFSALCRLMCQKEILTSDEFNSIVNKRRYHPPTETKPVIHAHWVRIPSVVFSHCKQSIDWQDAYCKHCGAKMDEELE